MFDRLRHLYGCGSRNRTSGLSGVAFYMSTLPIDRVKTVMMTQDFARPEYRSAAECFRDLYAREGLAGMYRGCLPTIARTFCGQVRPGRVWPRGRMSNLEQTSISTSCALMRCLLCLTCRRWRSPCSMR